MKIIEKREIVPDTVKTTCQHCYSVLEVGKKDGEYVGDSQRDEDCFRYYCPSCGRRNSIKGYPFRY